MTLSVILEGSEREFARRAFFAERKSNYLKKTSYQKGILFCASLSLISYANLN
jgi:hypothetical protein